MKKKLLTLSLIMILFSCQNEDVSKSNTETIDTQNQVTDKICASQELLEQQLKEDPTLTLRMNKIEAFTTNYIKNNPNSKLVDGKMVIPVQVNVLWKISEENVPWTQIQSQIDVLNADFNALNADYINVPDFFKPLRANIGIKFTLNPHINRKQTTNETWSVGTDMMKEATGGIVGVSPTTTLNIWVCDLAGVNGFASQPGSGILRDGVVIDYVFFGTSGSSIANYRTSTHEVGHWMGLKHIWGDASCGDDLVFDTPKHDSPNYGNPTYPHYSTCTGTPIEMTMNYMDYTGNKRYMFSLGQKTRMDATFAVGGSRASFRN